MRDFHRRIIRLEGIDPAGIGTQFLIADTPEGDPNPAERKGSYSVGDTVMSTDEWQATFSRPESH
jgi:hypothetical protein